jgi:subfamily B ATP-binding cassette protein MsbA
VNSVSVGYFTARCTALVKARIHSQVLKLTGYAGSGPRAVQDQIGAISGLLVALVALVALLKVLTYILVLVGISPWLLLGLWRWEARSPCWSGS